MYNGVTIGCEIGEAMNIDVEIVEKLIQEQFPKWSSLFISPVKRSGHDNRTFHLADSMLIRMPSGPDYVAQIEKENKWLPILAKNISLPITKPIALGMPNRDYPYPWAINEYIPGETACNTNVRSLESFAEEIAEFLKELQTIDTTNAPTAGEHNFYRGAHPSVYQEEVNESLRDLKEILPVKDIETIWEESINSVWKKEPVWIHGDIAPGNLLVDDGQLSGVIDFGIMGIGDPACDYAMGWTFFDKGSRTSLFKYIDEDTQMRARAWALWKALITYRSENDEVSNNARDTINEIIEEYYNEK